MNTEPKTPEDYLSQLPEARKQPMYTLRQTILENLPSGFFETISYGMIGYVVPHTRYPNGYHCDPELPLPFINIASQKNFIALYHMGLYADEKLLQWFVNTYPQYSKAKIDMGKSCIRFKKMDEIPYELIGDLVSKITPQEWINVYESRVKR